MTQNCWLRTAAAVVLVLGATAACAGGLDELPPDVAAPYQRLDAQQPVGASPLRDFKPRHGPPWTIGYASSYASNTWRAAAMKGRRTEPKR